MISIKYVSKFKKDLKRYQHQTALLQELNEILKLLIKEKKLPEKYRDHCLSGAYSGMRECHIKPDVLLVYTIDKEKLILERIGSHAELF